MGTHAGLTLSLLATAGAAVAEAAATSPVAEYTAQAALVTALCFVARYLIASQREHKLEMASTRDKHEALVSQIHKEGMESSQRREDLMRGAIEKQSLTMQELVSQSREQTDYFREVTQAALKHRLEEQ